jgi:hypothetical protein
MSVPGAESTLQRFVTDSVVQGYGEKLPSRPFLREETGSIKSIVMPEHQISHGTYSLFTT